MKTRNLSQAHLLAVFMGYRTRVFSVTPPRASPIACVLNLVKYSNSYFNKFIFINVFQLVSAYVHSRFFA